VLIARALCQRSDILVMDEPTSSLDYGNQLRVYAFLDDPQTVNRTLLEQGVGLISTQQKDSNLEDYFLNLIGGRHHG
jgi:ABC-2 type transport system ATP-binding protein